MVTVLISTFNGKEYLSEQIESILNQKDVQLQIFVRDDGSTDGTQDLLNEYKEKGILDWYQGNNLKSAKSFLNLLSNAQETDYYAFCDQDDIWNEDKLKRAIFSIEEAYKHTPQGTPVLYCSDYQLVDSELKNLGENNHITTTTFNAAIVSSCCTGCTVVFNQYLKKNIDEKNPSNIVMHDDWVHKVCLSLGGIVVYDNTKTLMYRQHDNNVDGGVHNYKDKIKGVLKRIKNRDCIRSKQLEELYSLYYKTMPEENKMLLESFIKKYKGGLFKRISIICDKRFKTPYKRLNKGYYLAVLFKYF